MPALVNRDYRDLFAEFNARNVEFLIVGAFALAVHGHLRATKDLDVWVRPTMDNAALVLEPVRGRRRRPTVPAAFHINLMVSFRA